MVFQLLFQVFLAPCLNRVPLKQWATDATTGRLRLYDETVRHKARQPFWSSSVSATGPLCSYFFPWPIVFYLRHYLCAVSFSVPLILHYPDPPRSDLAFHWPVSTFPPSSRRTDGACAQRARNQSPGASDKLRPITARLILT